MIYEEIKPLPSDSMRKLYSYSLIFSIVLNVYTYVRFNISYGEIFMLLIMFVSCLKKQTFKRGKKQNLYVIFLVYALIVTVINVILFEQIDVKETVKRVVRDCFYVVLIFVFSREYFDYKYAIKALNCLALALSIYIAIQFFAYILFGMYVPGHIDGLPMGTMYAADYRYSILKTASYDGFLRPTGFLREPSHCAHILSVALLLNLIPYKNKISYAKVIVYTLALVLTTSTNAIVFTGVAYMLAFFVMIKNGNQHQRMNVVIICLMLMIAFVIVCIKVPFVQSVVMRLTTIGERKISSSGIRLLRGVVFWLAMPLVSKLFGIGYGNFIGYREALGIWTEYEVEAEYMAMNVYVLTSVGVIGIVLLIAAIFQGLKNKNIHNWTLMLLFIVIGISSSVYSSIFYAITLSFVFFDKTISDRTERRYGNI